MAAMKEELVSQDNLINELNKELEASQSHKVSILVHLLNLLLFIIYFIIYIRLG